MGEDNWLIEVVVLAMLAGFIALRLVSVLGRRTGHEEPAGDVVRRAPAESLRPARVGGDAPRAEALRLPDHMPDAVKAGLSAIAAVDPAFDPDRFVSGAKAAYGMILEAFWKGDAEALKDLVSDDIAAEFADAITARNADGLRLENRLVDVTGADIVAAGLRGAMAEVTVRFDADVVAVTRDSGGAVVAGSTADAVETHDLWTFSRHTGATDPNWLLVATDDD